DFKPKLDEDNSRLGDVTLELGTILHERLVLVLGAKVHHVFHAGPVVPAAVEDDDFAATREMLQVALGIELGFLTIRWGGQGHETEHARTDALHDGLDGATLAGGVAPFEYHDDAQPLVHHPILKPA